MPPAALLLCAAVANAAGLDDPFADGVLGYDPGANAAPGFDDPLAAVGPPESFTGEGVFPGVVSPFNPPFGADEIVSVGVGGHLVVRFDSPVTDDPANPFGVDLLVFGNAFFLDQSFPSGVVGGLFADDGGIVEVSDDCETWHEVPGVRVDGLFPTLAWLDSGPYDATPGSLPTSFTWPVDPSLAIGDLLGLGHAEVAGLYDRSGGGAAVDLADVGLASATCVRISNPGDPQVDPSIEVDAVSDVAPDVGPADVDRDGVVGVRDFLQLLATWGACPSGPLPCPADVDGDGTVDTIDLLELLSAWSL